MKKIATFKNSFCWKSSFGQVESSFGSPMKLFARRPRIFCFNYEFDFKYEISFGSTDENFSTRG